VAPLRLADPQGMGVEIRRLHGWKAVAPLRLHRSAAGTAGGNVSTAGKSWPHCGFIWGAILAAGGVCLHGWKAVAPLRMIFWSGRSADLTPHGWSRGPIAVSLPRRALGWIPSLHGFKGRGPIAAH
jgi:hypothetical protein